MSAFRELQEECFEANRLLPEYKLIDLTFGNVSVADPERGIFAIKPSGADYRTMQAVDMVVCAIDEDRVVEGTMRSSSDTPTHRRLFQAFQGIRAIVHTHSRHAVAFAQARQEIPCLGTTHADYFHGTIPVTRCLSPKEIAGAYEWETGNVIVERFNDLDHRHITAVLVCGHGPFTWGTSGAEAVENALALEIVAEIAMKSLLINPGTPPLPAALRDKHFFRKHGKSAYYGQPEP